MVLDPLKRDIEAIISSLVIDWSEIEKYPEQIIDCRCGATFPSHAKFVGVISRMVSRKPCPSCGTRTNFRKVSSGWEPFELRR